MMDIIIVGWGSCPVPAWCNNVRCFNSSLSFLSFFILALIAIMRFFQVCRSNVKSVCSRPDQNLWMWKADWEYVWWVTCNQKYAIGFMMERIWLYWLRDVQDCFVTRPAGMGGPISGAGASLYKTLDSISWSSSVARFFTILPYRN